MLGDVTGIMPLKLEKKTINFTAEKLDALPDMPSSYVLVSKYVTLDTITKPLAAWIEEVHSDGILDDIMLTISGKRANVEVDGRRDTETSYSGYINFVVAGL